MTGPFINRTSDIEVQGRYAASYERAAASLAQELSIEGDPIMRDRLGKKIKHNREQAAFCRQLAEKLRHGDGNLPAS